MTPRRLAVKALIHQEQAGYANLVLDAELKKCDPPMNTRDAAFAARIFYTTLERLPLFAALLLGLLALLFLQTKALNALLLGADYARNLGIRPKRARTLLLFTAGALCAVVTALCGPIAFIGLAAPQVARLVHQTANHHTLLPMSLLWGANMALLALLLCHAVPGGLTLPVNAITPLMGVPVVMMLLTRRG